MTRYLKVKCIMLILTSYLTDVFHGRGGQRPFIDVAAGPRVPVLRRRGPRDDPGLDWPRWRKEMIKLGLSDQGKGLGTLDAEAFDLNRWWKLQGFDAVSDLLNHSDLKSGQDVILYSFRRNV